MTDHDQLFKELLRACFADFIALFLPEVYVYLDTGSIEFIEQESAGETTGHEKRAVDILVKARFKGRLTFFLIHVEAQANSRNWSSRRMFFYFAAQSHKHELPLYPIALLSWQKPRRPDSGLYVVDFPNRRVLEFSYDVIQLNRYDWRAYLQTDNPAAIALMAKMGVEPKDRPKVRAACIGLLIRHKLPERQRHSIVRFIDAYLPLTTSADQEEFKHEIKRLAPRERRKAMEYLTPTERLGFDRGMIEGRIKGKIEGKIELKLKMLSRRLGELSGTLQKRLRRLSAEPLDELAEALLDFERKSDLSQWLKNQAAASRKTE